MKRVLLLSPYDALSHAGWRAGLVRNLAGYDFEQVILPARYFSWRFRGNSLTLAHDLRLDKPFDLIVATSMTDLASLKGMRPALADVPTILYFHENQFAYPVNDERYVLDRQLTSLYSAISADVLVFNSTFNRRTFMEGVQQLLSRMPDHVPDGIVDALRSKSRQLPVPVFDECFPGTKKSSRFSVVWNHRWEYDKGVDRLREIIRCLVGADLDFVFHLLGQRFRQAPPEMQACLDLLDEKHKGHCGFIEDRREYLALLGRSHLVLSTARHEFQGVAVMEAVAGGCSPVVPDALSYPEWFDESFRYESITEAHELILRGYQQVQRGETLAVPDMSDLAWQRQASGWQALLDSLV